MGRNREPDYRKRQVMCELVEGLKNNIPSECQARRCTKEGCNVPLRGAPSPHLLVDMDCNALEIPPGGGRCDFLFVGCEGTRGAGWVVPLELKRGSPRATEIVEQLRAGAQFAEARISTQHKPTFLPVAVYGGKLHRAERDKLKESRNTVPFRDKTYEIKLMRCNAPLKNALSRKENAK